MIHSLANESEVQELASESVRIQTVDLYFGLGKRFLRVWVGNLKDSHVT